MIEEKEIEKIFKLARIRVEGKEKEKLKKDFLKILEFVEKIKKAPVEKEIFETKEKIFRKDEIEKEDWFDFEKLLSFPEKRERYLKVKKVLDTEG